MDFRRLLPAPGTVTLPEVGDTLQLPADVYGDRPYLIVNFVASADGRATLDGRSAPLSDDGDRAMFHALREQVDAVLVGTGTLRTERYGRLIRDSQGRERRLAKGLTAEPLACVVTRGGDVPFDIPLFAEPEQRVVVVAAEGVVEPQGNAEVVGLDPAELTLTSAARVLRQRYGVRHLLCEGGPTLFGALLQERLVDELFLTLAPKLAGGGRGPTISSGRELPDRAALRVRWLLEREGSLFLRYEIEPDRQ